MADFNGETTAATGQSTLTEVFAASNETQLNNPRLRYDRHLLNGLD